MLVPTVYAQTGTFTDHKELAAALKLLAGYECGIRMENFNDKARYSISL